MHALVFALRELPDLTLVKYSNVGARGIDGVLEAHQGFLRLFNRRPATSLHLLYTYDPTAHDGERLAVNLLVCDVRRRPDLDDVAELVASSPLSPFFEFIPVTDKAGNSPFIDLDLPVPEFDDTQVKRRPLLFESLLGPNSGVDARVTAKNNPPMTCGSMIATATWPWMASMAKRGRFVVQQPPAREAPNGFFTLPEYEQEDSGRLLALMRLMEALGESLKQPLAYRIDLYPTDRVDTLRYSLPLPYLKAQQSAQQGRRDYVLESVERSYEDSLRTLEASPLFFVNIFAFAQTEELARALLDAASSEAVKKGNVHIAQFEAPENEPWHVGSFLTGDHWSRRRVSSDGSTVLASRTSIISGRRVPHPGYVHVNALAERYPHSDMQCLFTLAEVAPLFRLPTLDDGEAVQLRKETAPRPVSPEHAIYLGCDIYGHDAYFETRLLSRHAFISGVPGSGKTNTMHHFVTTLINAGVSVLIFEPAKHEYRALLNVNLKYPVRLLCPGGADAFPLRINPFQIPYGITVGHHIGRLVEVFEGSFPLEGALPFLLDRAIEAVYAAHDWDPKDVSEHDSTKTWPTISELYDQMEIELSKEDYGGEVRGNLASAIRMRIGGLTRRELGELFDVAESVYPPSDWLKMNAVIELEALGKSEANFFTLLLMVLIRESLMVDPHYRGPAVRHVIFIEEAHNLVGPEAEYITGENADPKMAATAFLSDMLREVRAYGEGIVLADQLPTAIAPEVLKNTGLKVALRMTSEDDRELLGSMMSASAVQLERLAVADPGNALVLYEGLQRPFELRMAEWMGVPGSYEYIEDDKKRSTCAKAREVRSLKAMLLNGNVDWYALLRIAVCSVDERTFIDALSRIERRWSGILDCCEQQRILNEVYREGRMADEDFIMRCQELDERVALLTSTRPDRPSIDKVFNDFGAALKAFSSRMRSWHGFNVMADSPQNTGAVFSDPVDLMEQLDSMDAHACTAHLSAVRAYMAWLQSLSKLIDGGACWLSLLRDDDTRAQRDLIKLKNQLNSARAVLEFYSTR